MSAMSKSTRFVRVHMTVLPPANGMEHAVTNFSSAVEYNFPDGLSTFQAVKKLESLLVPAITRQHKLLGDIVKDQEEFQDVLMYPLNNESVRPYFFTVNDTVVPLQTMLDTGLEDEDTLMCRPVSKYQLMEDTEDVFLHEFVVWINRYTIQQTSQFIHEAVGLWKKAKFFPDAAPGMAPFPTNGAGSSPQFPDPAVMYRVGSQPGYTVVPSIGAPGADAVELLADVSYPKFGDDDESFCEECGGPCFGGPVPEFPSGLVPQFGVCESGGLAVGSTSEAWRDCLQFDGCNTRQEKDDDDEESLASQEVPVDSEDEDGGVDVDDKIDAARKIPSFLRSAPRSLPGPPPSRFMADKEENAMTKPTMSGPLTDKHSASCGEDEDDEKMNGSPACLPLSSPSFHPVNLFTSKTWSPQAAGNWFDDVSTTQGLASAPSSPQKKKSRWTELFAAQAVEAERKKQASEGSVELVDNSAQVSESENDENEEESVDGSESEMDEDYDEDEGDEDENSFPTPSLMADSWSHPISDDDTDASEAEVTGCNGDPSVLTRQLDSVYSVITCPAPKKLGEVWAFLESTPPEGGASLAGYDQTLLGPVGEEADSLGESDDEEDEDDEVDNHDNFNLAPPDSRSNFADDEDEADFEEEDSDEDSEAGDDEDDNIAGVPINQDFMPDLMKTLRTMSYSNVLEMCETRVETSNFTCSTPVNDGAVSVKGMRIKFPIHSAPSPALVGPVF